MEYEKATTSNRDRRAKFIELANKRVSRTLKDLGLIANLANKRNYDYDDEQVKKIIKALQAELDAVKHSFTSESSGRSTNFEL